MASREVKKHARTSTLKMVAVKTPNKILKSVKKALLMKSEPKVVENFEKLKNQLLWRTSELLTFQ